MTTRTPQELVSHCNRLKAERAGVERHWREIAALMRPQCLPWLRGETRRQLLDSTARLASEAFAGGIYGMMTNPANRWFALRLHDRDLGQTQPVRDWLDEVEQRLLDSEDHAAILAALMA